LALGAPQAVAVALDMVGATTVILLPVALAALVVVRQKRTERHPEVHLFNLTILARKNLETKVEIRQLAMARRLERVVVEQAQQVVTLEIESPVPAVPAGHSTC